MIVINLTINIVLPDDRTRPVSFQQVIMDALKPRSRPGVEHEARCQLCKSWFQFYETPQKAKQGLAGHQSWCKGRRRK